MLRYDKLSRDNSAFKSFTGLSVEEFDSLYDRVESGYNRIKRKDAGRPFKLSLRDRLLMLLVYYRLYITSGLAGFLFGLDHANVLRNIHRLEPIVRECIPLSRKIHEDVRRLNNLDDIERYFPGFKAFIDATEQEIPRPRDKRRR